MPPDAELLRRYVDEHSESAFAELVRRHVDLVYAAALRQTGGDAHLAQDVGQQVFTQLARKARALARHPTLAGWLCRATRYCAIDARRARARRVAREREVEAMKPIFSDDGRRLEWERLQPWLDDALDALGETDRAAVALRFFEQRSFAAIGGELGLGENAARMRVDRALEKLRRALTARGCTSTAATLAAVLGGEAAAAAAPAAWVAVVAPAALATAAAEAAGGTAGGVFLLAMNKLTLAVVTGIAAIGLTTAGFTWKMRDVRRDNAALRAENDALRKLRATRGGAAEGSGPALGRLADAGKLTQLVARLDEQQARRARQPEPAPAAAALQNRGNGAPMAAIETFAWACSTNDVETLARQLYFDGDGRRLAAEKLAEMPAFLRERYRTPEELYAFFIAADCLVAPPPADPALLHQVDAVFLKSDRVEMRRKGASRGRQQYQWTPDGWKYVLPEGAVAALADQVLRTNPLPEPGAGAGAQ